MKQHDTINLRIEDLKNVAHKVLSVNGNISRWAQYPQINARYNELSKQSLNMVACKMLVEQAKNEGIELEEERFPLIALKRLFEKTVNGDIRGDHLEEILALGGLEKENFDRLIEEKILGETSGLTDALLGVNDEWPESKIYKIATKMATLVEINEIKYVADTIETEGEIYSSISRFRNDFPSLVATALNVNGAEFRFLQEVSKLRGSIRWLKQFRAKDCSVLEHNGEVAIFCWLFSLERDPSDLKKATKLFWTGLFHDIPERWTGDMASPVKDAVEGLRKATELFEEKVMEENVFSKLPTYQTEEIKVLMTWEEEDLPVIKGADYVSAIMECLRNYLCGSRDKYFYKAVRQYYFMKQAQNKIQFSEFFFSLAQDVFLQMSEDKGSLV